MSKERTLRNVAPAPRDHEAADQGRWMRELDRVEAIRLLTTVSYGRIVFTLNALPAIRPVNHILDGEEIIIRTRLTSRIATVGRHHDTVVAYQADVIDPVTRLGWSVVATGIARAITDTERVARYERELRPWVDRVMDTVIGIHPEIVSGFRLMPAEPGAIA